MKAKSHGEVCCIGAQEDFQMLDGRVHPLSTVMGKTRHDHSMIFSWFWKAGNRHITVSNSFDLEDSFLLCDNIKRIVDLLEEGKDLRGLSY
jgi:hypothetical protein